MGEIFDHFLMREKKSSGPAEYLQNDMMSPDSASVTSMPHAKYNEIISDF